MNIDLFLFNLIHNSSGHSKVLDFIGKFCGDYLGYVIILILIILLFINFKKYWKMVLEAMIAAVFTRYVLTTIIRLLWFRPRPFVALHFTPLISQSPAEGAFPSGHASFFFALSTIVYFFNKKAGIWFYIASVLIVLGRVFSGVHWPSDVLVGAVLGIFMGWILNILFRKHAHKIIKGYNNQTA